MKAKEYAALYRETAESGDPEKALLKVLHGFAVELGELLEKRGSRSEAAALGCFREIEQKYHAFARAVSDDKTRFLLGGFRAMIENLYPKLWDLIRTEELRETDRRGKIEAWRKA